MLELVFEWDPKKEQENIKEHGLGFEAAERIFFFFFCMERRDDDSSVDEERWQTMGFYEDVLFVVYTERGDAIRIISARAAEPFERRIYCGSSETHGWQRVNP
jgi:uncharacterized DUF497 family protein